MAITFAETATDLPSEIERLTAILDTEQLTAPAAAAIEAQRDTLAIAYLRQMVQRCWP